MPFESIEKGPATVVLDDNDPVLKKALRTAIFEVLTASLLLLFLAYYVIERYHDITHKNGMAIGLGIVVCWLLVRGIVAAKAMIKLRKGTIKKRLIIDSSCIVEEYSFGLITKEITRKTLSKNITKIIMHYNQVSLTAGDNRNIVLGYDLFGSRELMKSYADAVCEKAGVELQIVEGVA